ncbi:MAG TPA: hypothetical protein VN449_05035 [Gaiellaceae bacterium]|nr:hypothetical protein [Gaiellaceae bacterium]
MNLWARFWPVTGLAFVGLFVAAILMTDDLDTNDPDADIAAFYTSNSHQTKQIVAFLMILGACLLFVWFLAMLRMRLVQAEGGGGRWAALAFGSGLVATALWIVADALFSAPAFAADDTDKFHLDANTFRIFDGAGYAAWFGGTTIALGTVTATAIVALKTGLLPRWLAWLSFPVAVTMLVSFFFIPFLIMCGWIIVVALTLMVRTKAPAAATAPA